MPPSEFSAGARAVELAKLAGLTLDPWQEFVLEQSLGEREPGRWAAFEVGIVCARQNGKNEILIARELAGLFLLGERLLIHTAHEAVTSNEAFIRLVDVIEDCPSLAKRIRPRGIKHGKGAEGLELKSGQRIQFKTRTKNAGRGFSADFVALDEAMILTEAAYGALLPTLSARPNPQVWLTGSAVDQEVHEDGIVFARVRERGTAGDPSLAFFEFGAEGDNPSMLTDAELDDPESWATANPGLGIRIFAEHIEKERRSMDARTFAVERLGVGDWPRTDGLAGVPITPEAWRACEDKKSEITGAMCLALDVSPERDGSISVAGFRSDGKMHVEAIEHRKGTGWMVERIVQLVERHRPAGIVCDALSPAVSVLPELTEELKQRGLLSSLQAKEIVTTNSREHAAGCGMIFDAVSQDTLRHLGTKELGEAIRGSVKRPLSDAWAWHRVNSSVDISPLVAVTLALWGLITLVKAEATCIDPNEIMLRMREEGSL